MKVTGKNSLSNFILIALKVIFVLGILIYLTLPFLLSKYVEIFNPILNYTAALIIVYKFIKLFGSLTEDNPFIMENVKHLKAVSVCSLIISVIYIIGMFFIVSVFEIIAIAIFIIAWLGTYVLAELLKKATKYKEENDLTI